MYLCGVGVDPELLRISTVLDTLKRNGIFVNRYNLSNDPQKVINEKLVNDHINQYGPEGL